MFGQLTLEKYAWGKKKTQQKQFSLKYVNIIFTQVKFQRYG